MAEWAKKAGQWVNNNPERFSTVMSDLAGIVAPNNIFAASGLGRQMAERSVFSKAQSQQQAEQDDARRLLSGILSGTIRPTAREEDGFTGLALRAGPSGSMEVRADYTLSGASDRGRPDRESSSSLAGRPVSRPNTDSPWDIQVGQDGTPQFSWRDPSMQDRIMPPEAAELMLQARGGNLPQSAQPPQPTATAPSFSLNQAQAQSQRPLPLDILPIEQQMALAQSGRYTDQLNLTMAEMLQQQRMNDSKMALAWQEANRGPAPPKPQLYWNAEGESVSVPEGQVPPPGFWPPAHVPKPSDPPETTLDLARREQYRAQFYDYINYAKQGKFPTKDKDPRGNPVMSDLTPERVQQLNQMSMNLGNGEFYEYAVDPAQRWWQSDKPTIRTLQLHPEAASLLPKMRELALEDGWEKVIRAFKERGLLIESQPMPSVSGGSR